MPRLPNVRVIYKMAYIPHTAELVQPLTYHSYLRNTLLRKFYDTIEERVSLVGKIKSEVMKIQ
jgi:hypothetical protein